MSAPSSPQEPVQRSRSVSPFTEEIVRNLFDASQIPNDEIRRAVTTDATMVSNSVDPAQDAPPADDAPPSPTNQAVNVPGQATLPQRKRAKYGQKKMLAGSALYSVTGMPIDGIDGSLVGVIAECPNKRKNNGQFRVDWVKHSIGMPPSVNKDLLRRWYPSEMKHLFDIAIDAYNEAGPVGVKEILKLSFSLPTVPHNNVPTPAAADVPTPAAAVANPGIDTATPVRCIRRATLLTAADSVSTLTQSLIGSRQQHSTINRSTRSTASASSLVDSDSDDGSALDEYDNAWVQVLNEFDDESDDEEDAPMDDDDANENVGLRELLDNLEWRFDEVDAGTCHEEHPPDDYHGPTGLRPGVADTLESPTDCFRVCGGFTRSFVQQLVTETNDFFKKSIRPRLPQKSHVYLGYAWKPVTLGEMHRFLGIMLKISMEERDGGGYKAYFDDHDQVIYTGCGPCAPSLQLENSKGWAQKIMPLWRFQQIRGAFHPQQKDAGLGGDKCYQLRWAINELNEASKRTFIPSGHLSFDEGGVSCRSRLCPVRQYNKQKPQKFRVEFFILADSTNYNILHLDVYQGKNDHAAPKIHESLQGLGTTQKAVMNAVIQTGISKDTAHGYRCISMDRRYMCPELGVLLRDRCNILSTGTCVTSRKGWPKELMTMVKTKDMERGTCKVALDRANKVLCVQWFDNRIVNMCSTVLDSRFDMAQRREKNGNIRMVQCPRALKVYHRFMGGVDKGDQLRMHMGGFARKAHFKKWYKKSFFAILDCMLLNALVAWNLSRADRPDRYHFQRRQFYRYIAEELCNYKDPDEVRAVNNHQTATAINGDDESQREQCRLSEAKNRQSRCAVCQTDCQVGRTPSEGSRKRVFYCETCKLHVHEHVLEKKRKIHLLFPATMTCHDIVKTVDGKDIWGKGTKKTMTKFANSKLLELREMHKRQRTESNDE